MDLIAPPPSPAGSESFTIHSPTPLRRLSLDWAEDLDVETPSTSSEVSTPEQISSTDEINDPMELQAPTLDNEGDIVIQLDPALISASLRGHASEFNWDFPTSSTSPVHVHVQTPELDQPEEDGHVANMADPFVYEAQPREYWAGRFVSMEDRILSTRLSSIVLPRNVDPVIEHRKRMLSISLHIFRYLKAMCKTLEAQRSLLFFKGDISDYRRMPELLCSKTNYPWLYDKTLKPIDPFAEWTETIPLVLSSPDPVLHPSLLTIEPMKSSPDPVAHPSPSTSEAEVPDWFPDDSVFRQMAEETFEDEDSDVEIATVQTVTSFQQAAVVVDVHKEEEKSPEEEYSAYLKEMIARVTAQQSKTA